MSHAAPDPGQDAEIVPAIICGEDPALAEDALDRRAALEAATTLAEGICAPWGDHEDWLALADRAYRWLRARDTLRPVTVSITPLVTSLEGATPVATTFDLQDNDQVVFSLSFADSKGAPVPAPVGFSAAWTLADPDATGAVLTPSADTTTATLAAGVPDTNLLVSVAVTITNPDGSTTVINGAEAVIVTSGPAQTVSITPGTPTPETPA